MRDPHATSSGCDLSRTRRSGCRAAARWLIARASGVSVLLSVLAHAGVVAMCAATALRGVPVTPPRPLIPEGISVVASYPADRRARSTLPARPSPPAEAPRVEAVPLEVTRPPVPETRPKEERQHDVSLADVDALALGPMDDVPRREPLPAPPERPSADASEPNVPEVPEPRRDAPVAQEPAETPPSVEPPRRSESQLAPAVRRGVDKGVEVVHLPTPRYPPSCRRRGQQGLVLLEAEVLADGSVGRIRILRRAPSPRLDEAAIDAVRRATFVPALCNGRPVAAAVVIPVRFELR